MSMIFDYELSSPLLYRRRVSALSLVFGLSNWEEERRKLASVSFTLIVGLTFIIRHVLERNGIKDLSSYRSCHKTCESFPLVCARVCPICVISNAFNNCPFYFQVMRCFIETWKERFCFSLRRTKRPTAVNYRGQGILFIIANSIACERRCIWPNVSKFVRSVSDGFLCTLEACLVNLEFPLKLFFCSGVLGELWSSR